LALHFLRDGYKVRKVEGNRYQISVSFNGKGGTGIKVSEQELKEKGADKIAAEVRRRRRK
jgi:hypothetical protein